MSHFAEEYYDPNKPSDEVDHDTVQDHSLENDESEIHEIATHEMRLEDDQSFHIAVAMPVDDDHSIPKAVVVLDRPEHVPPHPKSRQLFLLFLAFTFVLVFGLVVRCHIFWQSPQALQNPASMTPRNTLILHRLAEVVGDDHIFGLKKDDPYALAQQWILYDDPLQLEGDSTHLVQRFVLAVLYFQFHQRGEFRWCNAAVKEDSDTVCSFGGHVGDTSTKSKQSAPKPARKWLSIHHECTWGGISCIEILGDGSNSTLSTDNWEVSELHFPGLGVDAPLPSNELLYLPWLETIDFENNQFHGTLPPEWAKLPAIKEIRLNSNDLQGSIPDAWADSSDSSMVSSLKHFDVCSNSLSGSLPTSFLALMSNAEVLNLQHNTFTGTIPTEIFQLNKLVLLSLYDNLLTGTIPTEIGEWKAPIIHISLFKLNLEGTIPSTISQLFNLRVLDLSKTNIEGIIPEEFYDIPRLQKLDVSNTRLTGTLSPSIRKLSDLVHLDVGETGLSGPLPSSAIAELKKLKVLRINGNDLTGEISEEICKLRGTLGLHEIVADCEASDDDSLGGGGPWITCSCCDSCCNHETSICSDDDRRYS